MMFSFLIFSFSVVLGPVHEGVIRVREGSTVRECSEEMRGESSAYGEPLIVV